MDILSAVAISYGMWFILHNLFKKIFVQFILKRSNDARMTVISWELVFSAFCIVTCLNCLPVNDIFSSFTLSSDHLPPNLSFAFMIGGFLHCVSVREPIHDIYSCSFWRQLCLTLFSTSAFKLGCLDFYFKSIFIISVMDQCLWLIRVLCFSEETSIRKSWLLTIISSVYCFLWCFVYLFLIPSYILLPAAFTRTNSESIPSLLLLNLSLWVCFLCEFINSSSLQVLKEMFLCRTVNVDLFSFKENILTRQDFALLKRQIEKNKQIIERLKKAAPSKESLINKKTNPAALIQTVKCYLAVKRRLRNVREKNQSGEAVEETIENQGENFTEEDPDDKSE